MCARLFSALSVVVLVAMATVNPAAAQLRTPPRGAQAAPAAKPAPEPKPAPTPTPAPSAELADLKTKLGAAETAKTDAEAKLAEANTKVADLEQKIAAGSPGDCGQAMADLEKDVIAAKRAATVATNDRDRLQRERNRLELSTNDALRTVGRYHNSVVIVGTLLMIALVGFLLYKKNRRAFIMVTVILLVLAVYLFFGARPAGAATFACVNPATAASLDKAYPIAVIGLDNEIKCSGSGTAVEVKDESGAVIPITGNPSSFKINPTVPNTGRASISVDGKKVSILAIGEGTDASFGNIWLDMSRQIAAPATSGVDIHVRKLIEGMACGTDTSCLTDFRRKAWGSARGSSAAAGATLRVEIVEQTLSDPRLANATKAALDAFAANMPAVGVSESRAKEIALEEAQTAVAPVHVRVDNIDARVTALDSRVGTVETGLSEARAEAATLRKALLSARVPRSGPAGFLGATRTLVPEPKPARAANAKKK